MLQTVRANQRRCFVERASAERRQEKAEPPDLHFGEWNYGWSSAIICFVAASTACSHWCGANWDERSFRVQAKMIPRELLITAPSPPGAKAARTDSAVPPCAP